MGQCSKRGFYLQMPLAYILQSSDTIPSRPNHSTTRLDKMLLHSLQSCNGTQQKLEIKLKSPHGTLALLGPWFWFYMGIQ